MNHNKEQLEQLGELIEAGQQVEETLTSKGWTNHIGKLLDKMILDVVGGKENGRWSNGALDSKTDSVHTLPKQDELLSLMAYKKALTDLHQHIYRYIDDLKQARHEYSEIQKDEKEPTYVNDLGTYT